MAQEGPKAVATRRQHEIQETPTDRWIAVDGEPVGTHAAGSVRTCLPWSC